MTTYWEMWQLVHWAGSVQTMPFSSDLLLCNHTSVVIFFFFYPKQICTGRIMCRGGKSFDSILSGFFNGILHNYCHFGFYLNIISRRSRPLMCFFLCTSAVTGHTTPGDFCMTGWALVKTTIWVWPVSILPVVALHYFSVTLSPENISHFHMKILTFHIISNIWRSTFMFCVRIFELFTEVAFCVNKKRTGKINLIFKR